MEDSKSASVGSRKVIASKLHLTTNGKFRIVCIPVSSGDTWTSSLELLESKKELKPFSRAVAVMRIGEGEVGTETQIEEKLETPGFEGVGSTILTMLDRYKIDNVLICVVARDFSLMRASDDRSFETVCRFTKEFLLELYSSLVEFKIIEVMPDDSSTLKHFDLPLPGLPETIKQKQKAKSKVSRRPVDMEFKVASHVPVRKERPNCVFDLKAHAPQKERQIDPLKVQKQVIENSLKVKAQEIERCAQLLEDNDFVQIQSLGKFHNYEIVKKVFQILMVLNGVSQDSDVNEFVSGFDIRNFVRFGSVSILNPEKMESVSCLLKSATGLTYEAVKSFNKKFGILFQYMLSLVRCYDLNLRYALILHQIEERKIASSLQEQRLSQGQLPHLDGAVNFKRISSKAEIPMTVFGFDGLPPPASQNSKEPYFSKDIRLKYKYIEMRQHMEAQAREESGTDEEYTNALITQQGAYEPTGTSGRRGPKEVKTTPHGASKRVADR